MWLPYIKVWEILHKPPLSYTDTARGQDRLIWCTNEHGRTLSHSNKAKSDTEVLEDILLAAKLQFVAKQQTRILVSGTLPEHFFMSFSVYVLLYLSFTYLHKKKSVSIEDDTIFFYL